MASNHYPRAFTENPPKSSLWRSGFCPLSTTRAGWPSGARLWSFWIALTQSNQHATSMQSLPAEHEFKFAFAHAPVGIADRLPRAAIPQLDIATNILPGWDVPLENGIFNRVILDRDRHTLVRRVQRRPLWNPQLHSTPSCWSRKSQCRPARCAACFCTTKSCFDAGRSGRAGSSGITVKCRQRPMGRPGQGHVMIFHKGNAEAD